METQSQAINPAVDPIDEEVDEALRLTGGDARAAVRGLILGQRQLQREIAATVSAGYVRRKPQRQSD